MARVNYEHVTKHFREVVAVEDLTLEIADKEFLVLVGPSGCGKSTVIRLLAGLEQLTAGNIYIGEQIVNDLPVRDRDVAMVFQSYALYPHMNVFDNMAFGLRMHKTPKHDVQRRVMAAAEALGIEDLLKRKPAQLSGGQRQRVALGRAIVREPAVFLFDEPLSNLDAKLRVQTRTELSKLHQRLGTTFIYVTHDQVEAMTMATRIAVLKDGLLQQVGTPEDLYFGPENLFVAGFIGSPAMNFVSGTLMSEEDTVAFVAGPLHVTVPTDRARRLAGHVGTEVVVGIRPEDLHAPGDPPRGVGQSLQARIDVAEMMGNEKLLHVIAGPHKLLARVDLRTQSTPGQDIELTVDVERLHVFDAKTQIALDIVQIPEEVRSSSLARAASPQERP